MYAFDCRIAYSTDCSKTQHRVKPEIDTKCKNTVSVTDTYYCFQILDEDIM